MSGELNPCTFTRLQLPGLQVEEKYKEIIAKYMADLQFVQSEYMEHKEDPPLARNLPPVSGKIAWSRQLYHRIAAPVEVFQTNDQLMQLPDTKKAIKKFNRLARVLVEYELVFLQIWTKQIDAARVSLNSTVLVRHPDTGELYVNFDKKVLELLRDVQVLQGMGVEMPTQGLQVYGKKNAILERYDAVRVRNCCLESHPRELAWVNRILKMTLFL